MLLTGQQTWAVGQGQGVPQKAVGHVSLAVSGKFCSVLKGTPWPACMGIWEARMGRLAAAGVIPGPTVQV